MTQISPYLTFNGNCREAMVFYQECLGGELDFQTVGESPFSGKMPPQMSAKILHATLTRGEMVMMASDMVPEKGLIKGNAQAMMLQCSTESEIKTYYTALSAGGEARHPPENTFWGATFGDLTDKFGNNWILSCSKGS